MAYSDLNKTQYPSTIDERATNIYFKENVNFSERTADTNPSDYYVFAEDVNSLQESIIAVERSLGIMPQGANLTDTVAGRITDIESFVMMNTAGFANLDERYMWGGLKPAGLAEDAKISIKYHLHDGTSGGAEKISLAQHVTGTLSKTNLDLTSKTATMLTAEDIYMNTAVDATTISSKFSDKYDKTGGSISGDVSIGGKVVSRIFAEIDAASTPILSGMIGANIADSYTESGNCRKALSTDSTGIMFKSNVNLRYGDYVVCVRAKVSSTANAATVCKIYAKYQGTEISQYIKPSDFVTGDSYQTLYFEYSHRNNTGASARGPVEFGIGFYTGIVDVSIDSIVITPIHTSVYDDVTTLRY